MNASRSGTIRLIVKLDDLLPLQLLGAANDFGIHHWPAIEFVNDGPGMSMSFRADVGLSRLLAKEYRVNVTWFCQRQDSPA